MYSFCNNFLCRQHRLEFILPIPLMLVFFARLPHFLPALSPLRKTNSHRSLSGSMIFATCALSLMVSSFIASLHFYPLSAKCFLSFFICNHFLYASDLGCAWPNPWHQWSFLSNTLHILRHDGAQHLASNSGGASSGI